MATMLGCAADYGVLVHTRGGSQAAIRGQLIGFTRLEWSRELDDTSSARLVFPKKTLPRECCGLLSELAPWAHEITIRRDRELVWEGPISVDIVEDADSITVTAGDVIAYLDARTNNAAYAYTNTDPVQIGYDVIQLGLSGNDPDVGAHVTTWISGPPGVNWAVTQLRSVTIGGQLRALSKVGLDFSTVGRTIRLTGEAGTVQLPHAYLQDQDFTGPLEVVRPGRDAATRVIVHGDGVTSVAEYYANGDDPVFGRLERVYQVPGAVDTGGTTLAAASILAQTNPPTGLIRVPPDVALKPSARLPIRELVCGNRINVTSNAGCLRFQSGYRLASVRAVWTPLDRDRTARERISISLAPLGAGYVGEAP